MQLKISDAFKEDDFSFKRETVGGVTTFLSMMYIIIVNPVILSQAGIPFAGALTATIVVSFIGCILMGVFSNNPIAIAPGMGINAFFTYTVVQQMHVSWQIALGVVFWSGIIFTILSITNIRTKIIKAIPKQIRYAVVAGIGLLIAFLALKSANIVAPDTDNMIKMANINISFILFMLGLLFIGILTYYNYSSSLILGIVGITVIYLLLNLFFPSLELSIKFSGIVSMPDFSVFGQLDLVNSLSIALWPAIFAFIFTVLFDSLAGAIGICEAGNLLDDKGEPRNFKQILTVEGISGILSGIFGTSSAIGYIESITGIKAGTKTGFGVIVTGLLFLPFLFLSPLLSLVPAVATAPVLFIVGVHMIRLVIDIDWDNIPEAVPALLTMFIIPLTGSITHGVILGLILWTAFKLFISGFKDLSYTLVILNLLSIVLLVIEIFY